MEILKSLDYHDRFMKHFFNGCNYYFSKIVGYETLLNLAQKRIVLNLLDDIVFETNELIDDYGITSITCQLLIGGKKNNLIVIKPSEVHVNTYFIEYCLLASNITHQTENGFIFYCNKFICDSLSKIDELNKDKCLYYLKSNYVSYNIDLTSRDVELIVPLEYINRLSGNHYELELIEGEDKNIFCPFKENAIYYQKLFELIESDCNIIYNKQCLNILCNYINEVLKSNFKNYIYKLDKLNTKVNLYLDFSRNQGSNVMNIN